MGIWIPVGRTVTDAAGYDTFISYSHALDGVLAPTLQKGLEQFAKPWYRPRALRVFRDNASLTANPGLWTSIEKALASSRWFVLMASPDAARSPWVDREVTLVISQTGKRGISRFSRMEVPHMPWIFDHAGPLAARESAYGDDVAFRLLYSVGTPIAPFRGSIARPATCPCQRFATPSRNVDA